MSTTRVTQRTRSTVIASLGAGFLVLFATACSSAPEETPQTPPPSTSSPTTSAPPPTTEQPAPPALEEAILGKWVSGEPGDPYLEFHADGTLSGSDGCNGVGGTYTIDEATQTAPIERSPSTLMACLDIDDWLRDTQSVALAEENTLEVFDGDGQTIGQLQRD